jgi:putative membrane protein
MKQPVARPTASTPEATQPLRTPRAFEPAAVQFTEPSFDTPQEDDLIAPPPRRMGWVGRLAWTAGGILISAGLGLAADRLIRDLFARYEILGWAGLVVLALLLLALIVLAGREMLSLRRLRVLDTLRREAATATADNDQKLAHHVATQLETIYADRPDLARM